MTTPTPIRMLILEDSEDDLLLLLREVRRGGIDPAYERADSAEGLTVPLTPGSGTSLSRITTCPSSGRFPP